MTPSTPLPPGARPRAGATWLRRAAWVVALVALLGTFSFYTHPDFMVGMADKLWSCF